MARMSTADDTSDVRGCASQKPHIQAVYLSNEAFDSSSLEMTSNSRALLTRTKQACRVCHARRVRCDVLETKPCTNCKKADVDCVLAESKRGKYQRARQAPKPGMHVVGSNDPTSTERRVLTTSIEPVSGTSNAHVTLPPGQQRIDSQWAFTEPQFGTDPIKAISANHRTSVVQKPQTAASNAHSHAERDEDSAVYLGESTSLRYLQEIQTPSIKSNNSCSSAPDSRLHYPIYDAAKVNAALAARQSRGREAPAEKLHREGSFTLPAKEVLEALLLAYFEWFHPCFPIVDRLYFINSLKANTISPLLIQSMLFIGVVFCSEETVAQTGEESRQYAKSLFYYRAKDIYDADFESNKLAVLQSLFLMSFWRAGPLLEKNTRHWLGAAISLAQSKGLHRSYVIDPLSDEGVLTYRSSSAHYSQVKLRKRLWWFLYVRERQCSAALGLPNRIRDEDCDIEALEPSDFDDGDWSTNTHILGTQRTEHIHYAIEMCKLSKILGKVVLTQFLPKNAESVRARSNLKEELDDWDTRLPPEMSTQALLRRPGTFFPSMLHLTYNNLLVLLYRAAYIGTSEDAASDDGHIAFDAACANTRIIEDMLAHEHVQYGQMHMITSLFNTLCIHTISIRRTRNTARKVAEHRAKLCLLGLAELQKTWESDNWVLNLFLQLLDRSIAKKLRTLDDEDGSNGKQATQVHYPGANPNENLPGHSTLWSQQAFSDVPPCAAQTDIPMDWHFSLGGFSPRTADDLSMFQFQPGLTSLNTMSGITALPYTNVMLGMDGLSQVDMDLLASCL